MAEEETDQVRDEAAALLQKKLEECKEGLKVAVAERSRAEEHLVDKQKRVDLFARFVSDYETALAAIEKYKSGEKAMGGKIEAEDPSEPRFNMHQSVWMDAPEPSSPPLAGIVWNRKLQNGVWLYLFTSSSFDDRWPNLRVWVPGFNLRNRIPQKPEAYQADRPEGNIS